MDLQALPCGRRGGGGRDLILVEFQIRCSRESGRRSTVTMRVYQTCGEWVREGGGPCWSRAGFSSAVMRAWTLTLFRRGARELPAYDGTLGVLEIRAAT